MRPETKKLIQEKLHRWLEGEQTHAIDPNGTWVNVRDIRSILDCEAELLKKTIEKLREPNSLYIQIPSNAFGIDVQNYGSDSELIYMIDISELNPNDIEGERLITKKLGDGNYKIETVLKENHGTFVTLTKTR